MAAKSDPIAMKDEDYPDWLWTLSSPRIKNTAIIEKKSGNKDVDVATEEKLSFGYLRTQWRPASRQKKKI